MYQVSPSTVSFFSVSVVFNSSLPDAQVIIIVLYTTWVVGYFLNYLFKIWFIQYILIILFHLPQPLLAPTLLPSHLTLSSFLMSLNSKKKQPVNIKKNIKTYKWSENMKKSNKKKSTSHITQSDQKDGIFLCWLAAPGHRKYLECD